MESRVVPRHRIPPKYRHYKPKNLALVVLDGKQYYLGRYNSPESWDEYHRLVKEHMSNPSVPPPAGGTGGGPTISEVIVAFWGHAEGHYRAPDGSPTGELENLRAAVKPLRRLYGTTPARDFGAVALRAVRQEMIDSGLSRRTVNDRVNRVRRVFKWAASVELIPASVVQALQTVAGLQKGRSKVKESSSVAPVPAEHVEAVLPYLSKPVAAMVRLQLLTGCRLGEVVLMRGCDLISGDPVWEYRPSRHKNTWRGQERVIPLGPRAQAIVKEFLKHDPDAYLFSPRDVVETLQCARTLRRASKATPSELARRRREAPVQKHRAHYERRSYRQAIVRACLKAGVPAWSPLQLRHTSATLIRSRYGLEAAQVILGHTKADVTQVYAERDLAKAQAIMAEIG